MPQTTLRILVVDDDAGVRGMLTRILNTEGMGVVAVEDGDAALAALGAQTFDLVILDLMLPTTSGFAVLAAIRGDAKTALLPVIVLSAWLTIKPRAADAALAKPFKLVDLWATINQLVSTRVVPR